MPPPGHQHRDTHATTNPFLDNTPPVTGYTAQEIATLQSRLEKQLGPEFISTRPGAGGGKVHYLAAEKVINLANEVFGFNGWSSGIQNVQVDFVDENAQNGKISLGLSTIVRVTLRDGTFHEDIGYGQIENCKGKAAAFEKAKKEAATDALKRALRNFGNVLGNCLYDKDYLQKVTKVKVAPSKWDSDNLHRHPNYAPIKRESIIDAAPQEGKREPARRNLSEQSGASFGSADFEDDFGGNVFDEADFDHPDEVRVDDTTLPMTAPPAQITVNANQYGGRRNVSSLHSTHLQPPDIPPPKQPPDSGGPQNPATALESSNNTGLAQPTRMLPPQQQQHGAPQQLQRNQQYHQNRQQHQTNALRPIQNPPETARSNPSSGSTVVDSPSTALQQQKLANDSTHLPQLDREQKFSEHDIPVPRLPPPGAPEGFVTGRSAELLQQSPDVRPPIAALAFNPHADSPSIRRTRGVNPGKSAPVSRQQLNATTGNGQSHAPAPIAQDPVNGNGANGTSTPVRTNFVNPAADLNRRIGMPQPPGGMGVPMQNRSTYKPPTSVGPKRPPLNDMSNVQQMDGTTESTKKACVEPTVEFESRLGVASS